MQHKILTGLILLVGLLGTGCDLELRQFETKLIDTEVVASSSVAPCKNGIPDCLPMTVNNFNQQDKENILQTYTSVSDITVEEQAPIRSDDSTTANQTHIDGVQSAQINRQDQSAPPTLAELSHQALYQADVQKRIDAVNTITLYRNDQAIETLLQATSDSEPAVRYLALQTLRYAVADGLDEDGRIVAVLEQARLDYDQQVALLAERFVKELSTSVDIETP